MNLTGYVEALRQQLAVAAAAGGDEAQALAERLTAPLDSATRLVLLDALSAAAGEITRDMAPGSVDLRLRDREPTFVVTLPPTAEPACEPSAPQTSSAPTTQPALQAPEASAPEADDAAMVRINLRLPEHLKGRVEEAAGRAGLSVNAWLVRAATAALDGASARSAPGDQGDRASNDNWRVPRGGQRFTGWVR